MSIDLSYSRLVLPLVTAYAATYPPVPTDNAHLWYIYSYSVASLPTKLEVKSIVE